VRTVQRLLNAPDLPTTASPNGSLGRSLLEPQSSPLTKSRAAYLIVKRVENRDSDDTKLLTQIVAQHSALALAVELADEFLQFLRQQRADDFDDWLMKALKRSIAHFHQKLGRTQLT
jgi:transposase